MAEAVSFRTRFFYGAGGAAYAAKEAAYISFILLFYTQVLTLNATITGIVLAIGVLWDAITDPLVGAYSDRVKSRLGRRHLPMTIAIIPIGIGFLGLFSPPTVVSSSSYLLPCWLLFWTLWVRSFVTLFSIPHLALATEITSDYQDRSQVLGARLASMFGTSVLLPALAFAFIFVEKNGIDGRFIKENYAYYGALSCLLAWIVTTTTVLGTQRYAKDSRHERDLNSDSSLAKLWQDLTLTLDNQVFRSLIAFEIPFSMAYGVLISLNMFAWTYFWKFSATQVSIMLSLPSLIAIVMVMFSLKPLSRRWEKHQQVRFAMWVLFLNCLWLYPLRLTELIPSTAETLSFVLNLLAMFVFMYFFLLRSINVQSITVDVTDLHLLRHGQLQEGSFLSIINFCQKFAAIFGPIYGGMALDFIGLENQTAPNAIAHTTQIDLVLAMGIGVLPLTLLSLYLGTKIFLSRAQVESIQSALKARKLGEFKS
mgnify:CR=1 FL=1